MHRRSRNVILTQRSTAKLLSMMEPDDKVRLSIADAVGFGEDPTGNGNTGVGEAFCPDRLLAHRKERK